ncbi:bifunctional phosphopantothenoylcysteine decarboxylase/phosphopantothenate--cysteine ligase CoaBC [Nafulsella turpanensis]|uniref:bifunctional phosphopantothenoylcysteine decarboxylase/phosphopantothenate--cysteine ligase CoaBC n=1 Tax=Nafulsella turpanensis TaxID=1265690 RepID=UPI0003455F5A|nr:bifunctional phosphopantothenoylcysteine decarboxylase/phosphopantothenate--cysteine ligase CoaBC [Nafulsella turpanensis]
MKNHVLHGKKIILGVCGSIAAYKSAYLVRLLVKAGAEVQVVMTTSAIDFISPLTLATLSKKPVLHQYVKNSAGEWNNHVALGLWADLVLIAPATAHTIAKLANGLCDNLLSAVYLSARCPVFIAPAMDLDMYQHGSTRHNLQRLQSYGNTIIAAEWGELASGLEGQGRLAEPEEIAQRLEKHFQQEEEGQKGTFQGKKVLITAGPTYEDIDPVRFIGNHSTGKMGFALAEAAAEAGAEITLVCGPVHLQTQHPRIRRINVRTAEEMYEQCRLHFTSQDVAIFAAAVADYKPAQVSSQKIKKKETEMALPLTKTVDVALSLGKEKKAGQFTVGFALETEHEQQYALDKLRKKQLDMIVLNSLNDEGAGFGHDTNKIMLFGKDGSQQEFPLKSKQELAKDIIAQISLKINA